MEHYLKLPLKDSNIISSLHAGDIIYITGVIYTARDAAHARLVELIDDHQPLPFDAQGSAIYYTGPTPPKPGEVIGSCGPTSSYRLDCYSEKLMQKGVKVMIGKGPRNKKYRQELIEHRAVYLSAIGGAGALIAKTVKKSDIIAYPDLQSEAIYRLEVQDFYAIVTYDSHGKSIYPSDASI